MSNPVKPCINRCAPGGVRRRYNYDGDATTLCGCGTLPFSTTVRKREDASMVAAKDCPICYKFHHPTISKGCRICGDFEFPEHILCEITRAAQAGTSRFECNAFKPQLSIVSDASPASKEGGLRDPSLHTDFTEKIKWLNAYAQQQLERDPNHTGFKLRYHLTLITKKRKSLFTDRNKCKEKLTAIFSDVGNSFQGTAHLLGLGKDHLHIYIDASPDFSLDDIGNLILDASEDGMVALLEKGEKDEGEGVFERNYFVETIG